MKLFVQRRETCKHWEDPHCEPQIWGKDISLKNTRRFDRIRACDLRDTGAMLHRKLKVIYLVSNTQGVVSQPPEP